MEIQLRDLGKNNPDKTNASEEEGNYMGQHGTEEVHIGETTNQWFPT